MFCSVIYESIHWSTYVIKWIASIIIPAVYQWVSFLPAAAVAVLLLLELLLLVAVVTVWLRLEEVDEVLEVLELVFEVRPRIVALGGSGWLTWKFHMDTQKEILCLGKLRDHSLQQKHDTHWPQRETMPWRVQCVWVYVVYACHASTQIAVPGFTTESGRKTGDFCIAGKPSVLSEKTMLFSRMRSEGFP